MNGVPLELPLRPGEAGQLAEMISEAVGGRALTDDARTRLSGRAGTLGLKTVRPYFGSLEADPVHAGVYYLAVDGLSGDGAEPLLLRMAPSAAPASGLFPKALLIGRMRAGAGGEVVINAIPFGPEERGAIEAYARELGPKFLPRAQGLKPAVRVAVTRPAEQAVAAFQAFRAIAKTTGRNVASFRVEASPDQFWAVVWAAIRSGYRDGYGLGGGLTEETARLFSFFRVRPENLGEAVKRLRSWRGGEAFDVEADLSACGDDELGGALEAVRGGAQTVLLGRGLKDTGAACAVVRSAGAMPALEVEWAGSGALAEVLAEAVEGLR